MNYTVIQDTREQQPWDFSRTQQCAEVVIETLKTGDYTLKQYESILCVERKATTGEISADLGKKRKQFDDKLHRMSEYRHSFVICEFSLEDVLSFPENSGIPYSQWGKLKMNGPFLFKTFTEYMLRYHIQFVFAGDKKHAQYMASSIFKRVAYA